MINHDVPNHLEDYVHRAGRRTGLAGQTGTAATFIMEEQEQYSVGIAKALEQSGQPIPESLEKMRKNWRAKVKSRKSQDSSGFGGKGLHKLDANSELARMHDREMHKIEGVEEDEKEMTDDEVILSVASAVKSHVELQLLLVLPRRRLRIYRRGLISIEDHGA